MAKNFGGTVAVGRNDVPGKGKYSLSPLTFLSVNYNESIVLPSPNGSTCTGYASTAEYVFAGALINAKATAEKISELITNTNLNLTIIACGERFNFSNEDGDLRFAVEDYLGAGAILSYLDFGKSAEALVCESAFLNSKDNIKEIILNCETGVELKGKGFEKDIEFSAQLDLYDAVVILENGYYKKL